MASTEEQKTPYELKPPQSADSEDYLRNFKGAEDPAQAGPVVIPPEENAHPDVRLVGETGVAVILPKEGAPSLPEAQAGGPDSKEEMSPENAKLAEYAKKAEEIRGRLQDIQKELANMSGDSAGIPEVEPQSNENVKAALENILKRAGSLEAELAGEIKGSSDHLLINIQARTWKTRLLLGKKEVFGSAEVVLRNRTRVQGDGPDELEASLASVQGGKTLEKKIHLMLEELPALLKEEFRGERAVAGLRIEGGQLTVRYAAAEMRGSEVAEAKKAMLVEESVLKKNLEQVEKAAAEREGKTAGAAAAEKKGIGAADAGGKKIELTAENLEKEVRKILFGIHSMTPEGFRDLAGNKENRAIADPKSWERIKKMLAMPKEAETGPGFNEYKNRLVGKIEDLKEMAGSEPAGSQKVALKFLETLAGAMDVQLTYPMKLKDFEKKEPAPAAEETKTLPFDTESVRQEVDAELGKFLNGKAYRLDEKKGIVISKMPAGFKVVLNFNLPNPHNKKKVEETFRTETVFSRKNGSLAYATTQKGEGNMKMILPAEVEKLNKYLAEKFQ